jgi:hypothetical protein
VKNQYQLKTIEMAKKVNEPEAEVKEAPKPKVRRFSNDDIYELLIALRETVEKECNLRKTEQRPGVVTKENAATLVGLSQGLTVVTQRYKIYAKPAKAF